MARKAGATWLLSYVATIFAANWAIATFGVVPVGFGLLAPAGHREHNFGGLL